MCETRRSLPLPSALSLLAVMLLACAGQPTAKAREAVGATGNTAPAPRLAAPGPIETRVIRGVIADTSDVPFPGAIVHVAGTQIQTVTGADGSFTLPDMATTAVVLEVDALRASGRRRLVTATVGADSARSLLLRVGVPAPGTTRTITGKVVALTTGAPLPGAQILVVGSPIVVFSEDDGAFMIEDMALGAATLEISAPEYESRVVDMPASRATLSVALALAPQQIITIESWEPIPSSRNEASP